MDNEKMKTGLAIDHVFPDLIDARNLSREIYERALDSELKRRAKFLHDILTNSMDILARMGIHAPAQWAIERPINHDTLPQVPNP